ncbi:MAG: glycosyltransferase family 1 protein [Acidobacteriota bacterium]
MRIALDATPLILTSGGLPRYVSELSLALAREFPEDTYVLLSDQHFAIPGLSTPAAAAPSNLTDGRAPGAAATATRRWWLWGVRQAIRKSGAGLFHGTNFEVPYLGRTPSILTIHDLSPWRNPEWHGGADRVRLRTPWLVRFRRARMILTVSEAVRREIISHFGLGPSEVRAVPLAASPLFRPVHTSGPPQNRPSSGNKPFFLFVGTLEPRKNVLALLDAWRATREQTGADLIIAGRTRRDFVPVEPCEGLTLLGEVPDCELPRLYSDALAFVYPTLYEGFGLPVLEAMQCGCPVITSQDPAVREVAGGAAIHAHSTGELAGAMKEVAKNAALRDHLRQAGLARAACFSWSRTARETRALYAELLGDTA